MSTLREPFTKQVKQQQEALELILLELDSGEKTIESWPEYKAIISNDINPRLREWISAMQSQFQSVSTTEIERERYLLEKMAGITHRNPQAIVFRLHNTILSIQLEIYYLKIRSINFSKGIWVRVYNIPTRLLNFIESIPQRIFQWFNKFMS